MGKHSRRDRLIAVFSTYDGFTTEDAKRLAKAFVEKHRRFPTAYIQALVKLVEERKIIISLDDSSEIILSRADTLNEMG